MKTGIYRIRNLITNDCYYGSSKNIEKRWIRHKNDLKNNKHINIILTRSWEKYGEENFEFEIVEICDMENLKQIEQKYLDLKPKYNIGISASGGDNLTNNPNRDLIIERITDSVKERYSKMTSEEKKEKHSKPLNSNPNWKGGISKSYCNCGEIKDNKAQTCSKCRNRSGDKNPFYGKNHNDTTKKILSENMMGKYFGKQNMPLVIDGIEYESLGKAQSELGIPTTTIRWRILSKNPKYKNYSYKDQVKKLYTEEEQYKRLSTPQLNKKRDHNKPFMIDGIEYRTLKEASEILDIHQMTIKGRIESKKFTNYTYI